MFTEEIKRLCADIKVQIDKYQDLEKIYGFRSGEKWQTTKNIERKKKKIYDLPWYENKEE